MAQRPIPLLEILKAIGFKRLKPEEYVGKTLEDVVLDNPDNLPQTLASLKIASIKTRSRTLSLSLSAGSYSQIFEAHACINLLKEKLQTFFNKPCKIKLTIGQ